MKHTVQAVMINDEGRVLAVSRKDNHNDFGLPGGKVDPEDFEFDPEVFDSPFHAACHREVMEETGLDIDMSSSVMVFAIHKDGFMGYTFLIKEWSGEIEYDEPHVVEWAPYWKLELGSFGKYNHMVKESLDDMGVWYYNEEWVDSMKKKLTEYVENNTMNGYIRPFKVTDIRLNSFGSYEIHIKDSSGSEPYEDWDVRPEEFLMALNEISGKYKQRATFPTWYYTK